jgi:hypothetical protein
MFMRRAFAVFLEVQSEAEPHGVSLAEGTADFTLDWRWFCEPVEEPALPSERSLIHWPEWARPKTPRRGSSAPR